MFWPSRVTRRSLVSFDCLGGEQLVALGSFGDPGLAIAKAPIIAQFYLPSKKSVQQ